MYFDIIFFNPSFFFSFFLNKKIGCPFTGKKYTLAKGDILCFEGDVIHAGAAYKKENTRIHIYVDVQDVKPVENMTWIVN